MEAEYVADEREFSGATLDNGMKCVFVHDPRMENVAVQLEVGGGYESEPAGLSGLANLCVSAILRGSARYPGLGSLHNFFSDYEILFQGLAYHSYSRIAAEVPQRAFDEYLDRLSDITTNPTLSQEGLEYAKLRYGNIFHPGMADVNNRVGHARDYMLWGIIYQGSSLFERTDLLTLLRQYFKRYYHPSNMIIHTMASLPIETMKERVQQYFGKLADKSDTHSSIPTSPGIDYHFYKNFQVDGHAFLAKSYTKSEEKQLNLVFPLPPHMQTSSPLYICHFFNKSQPESLSHKLKSEGLMTYIMVEHRTKSRDLQVLEIRISLTRRGFDNIQLILSYIFGYLEILKQMPPSYDHFRQARVYFQCLRHLDSSLAILDRYSCELLMGSEISDLREAEIPRVFDPNGIHKVLECLNLANCFIVVVSDQYVDAPLLKGSEFFLQLSIENFKTSFRFDGLEEPQLDPLIVGSRIPQVTESDLQLICEMPLAYQKSNAGEVYSMLNIGLKSSHFAELPVSVQRLYATMVSHKIWLETTKDICEVSISLMDNGLSIDVKSVPDSLAPLIRLLVKYLSSPIDGGHNQHLMSHLHEEANKIRTLQDGNQDTKFEPKFSDYLSCGVDLETQLQQLEMIKSVDDLPNNIYGDLVLEFSGNATEQLSLEVTFILTHVQEPKYATKSNIKSTCDD